MTTSVLDQPCGRHLKFRALIEAGETWERTRVPNLPKQPETWEALRQLASTILDPVIERFGPVEVTYGFASWELIRHISGRIYPSLDQHSGCELRTDGRLICGRRGQAVDFRSVNSAAAVATWIAENLPFDRMYFYGSRRPLHVSVGPQRSGTIVAMRPGPSGRRIPQVRSVKWLRHEADNLL